MQHYLRSTRDLLETGTDFGVLDIVIGNEACDLDSAVAALVHAYYLQSKKGNNVSVVPLLNILRKDFSLRTEVTFFLKEYELLQNSLTFRDEMDLDQLSDDKRLRLHLVDHNVLVGADSRFEDLVVEVIDHHKEERIPSSTCTTNIEMVGSCCTLVAETIFAEAPELLGSDAALIPLLLGTILLDTVNLSEQAGRATWKDIEMVKRLRALRPHLDPDAIFNNLQKAKSDVTALNTEDLLRKDMKSVHGVSSSPSLGHFAIAISSVPMHLRHFLQKENVEHEMMEFARHGEFSLIVIMGIVTKTDGGIERQVGVYSRHVSQRDMIASCLQSISLDLNLLLMPGLSLSDTLAFTQGNVKASRKQILPAIADFLKSL